MVWPQAAAWLDGWFLVGFVMAAVVVVLDTFTPTDFGRWSKAFKLPLCMHYCTGCSEKNVFLNSYKELEVTSVVKCNCVTGVTF